MRTQEEILKQIDDLKARQARIEEQYAKHIQWQGLPALEAERMPLADAVVLFDGWGNEVRSIQAQLRVLYWITGKHENFPWR